MNTKYRIKKKTYINGTTSFIPQKKWLIWFPIDLFKIPLLSYSEYNTLSEARTAILREFLNENEVSTVEYIPYEYTTPETLKEKVVKITDYSDF
jgi:hypothetical protein